MGRDRRSREEGRPLRLFVAADVPDSVRDQLASLVSPWKERLPHGRWVPPENWHVTLKFLGAVWPRLHEWVIEVIERAASEHGPFQSSLAGLGAFPTPRRARVLWAGLEDEGGGFARLAGSLDRGLATEFEPEGRPFTPHLTVARFDPPTPLPEAALATDIRSDPFPVDRVVLYRSHLRRPAPRYEPLREFPLGAGGPGAE